MAQPLTKLTRSGAAYRRPATVEANIDGAFGQELPTLRRRLLETDAESPDYLTSECLVHLFRDSTRRNDNAVRDVVVAALLARCEANLLIHLPDSRIPNAAHLREDILGEFAVMLAEDGLGQIPNALDYFECRFNRAFMTLRVTRLRGELQTYRQTVSLPSESCDEEEDEAATIRTDGALSTRATQADSLARAELLATLPPAIRQAVVLCHEMGYEEESNDPTKRTAASICGVTGRTIRTRLSQAAKYLPSSYQEEI